jgi:very-short-patch-repair endonuclease
MEKQCEICYKTYNAKKKNQKYCGVECQHNSYRKIKVERVKTTCLYCGKELLVLPNKLLNGKGKYCNRDCKDSHQKILYLGENNPAYGTPISDEHKKSISTHMKKLWTNEEYRNKMKKYLHNFFELNKYHFGTDEISKNKRKSTMIKRYGVPHNWNGKYGERNCDKKTLEKYGKTSIQMLTEYSNYYGKKTDIESLFEDILQELEIPYQLKFRIYDKEKIDFWFKEYDFLILNTNILIEVDGDYWHGNKKIFEQLSDFQKSVQENDKIKEMFAKKNGYEIVRFWGSDIKKNYEEVKNTIKKICEKLN